MAITNQDRVGKAMDLLKIGLRPFIERELKTQHGKYWITKVTSGRRDYEVKIDEKTDVPHLDIALLLRLMWEQWNDTFRRILGPAERTLVSELRDHRNKWAHQEAFSGDDAYRTLDSAARLLTAVSAPRAADIVTMKMELLGLRFDEQIRSEKRKTAGTAIESAGTSLKPWSEVVTPHKDVASGKYQQAEFAADLWQVHLGEGTDEYRNSVEFFRRTYLTESLKTMLVGAVRRLTSQGGDPVVQLQTHFKGDTSGLVVKAYAARQQIDAEKPVESAPTRPSGEHRAPADNDEPAKIPTPPAATQPRRFHGTVTLDAARIGRDAGRIADEVIAHLSGLVDAKVTVTREVTAEIPSGRRRMSCGPSPRTVGRSNSPARDSSWSSGRMIFGATREL